MKHEAYFCIRRDLSEEKVKSVSYKVQGSYETAFMNKKSNDAVDSENLHNFISKKKPRCQACFNASLNRVEEDKETKREMN